MSKRKKSSIKLAPQVLSRTSISSALPFSVTAGVAIIILVVFIAYFPSISGDFILDDDLMMAANKNINASDGLFYFWCTDIEQDYWPMTSTTFWLEWRMWDRHTTGYHITNLILHIVESLLIWLILRRLSIPGAFLAAVFFAVHPVNVESVAWIAQRKNTMAMLFFLLSILCYLRLEMQSPQPQIGIGRLRMDRWYWLSLCLFVLAMFSKGSVAVLPVLLLGIVWWLRPLNRWDLVRTAPFFLIAVILGGVNVWFQKHGLDINIRTADFTERLLGAGGATWFYLYKAILPVDLYFVYPMWHIKVENYLWWLPLIAAMMVTAVLWWYRKSWSRPYLFAWGFFCMALVPVAGFTDVGFMRYSLVADRYQHIAIIGVVALVASGWRLWQDRVRGGKYWAGPAVVVMAVGSLICLTWRQNTLYSDPITLYQVTLKKNPDFWLGYYNLGNIYLKTNRMKEAEKNYEQTLRLNPKYLDAHTNMGVILAQTGRPEEAIEHFQIAVRINPSHAEAQNNLGNLLLIEGLPKEAIEHFRQAVSLSPDFIVAHLRLGDALCKIGRWDEAIEHYRKALSLAPNFIDVHNSLGIALTKTGRTREAIEHFQRALALKPGFTEVYFNLATAYADRHQSSEAIAAAQKALGLARSKGQTEQVKQIEEWLNNYRAKLSNLPNTPSPETVPRLP
jgi:protein O-mannosyl-transferase